MVIYNINIMDSNGKKIPNTMIDIKSRYPYEELDIIIDSLQIFSKEELDMMMDLIVRRVDYGGDVTEIYEYIKLYKKIEKIVERK